MRSLEPQKGASLLGWLFWIALIGLAVVIGFKLVPVYLNSYTVSTVLNNVATEAKGKDYGPNQLWTLIDRRLDINSISDLHKNNFHFERNQDTSTITIRYEDRKHMIGNIDAVVTVAHSAQIDNTP